MYLTRESLAAHATDNTIDFVNEFLEASPDQYDCIYAVGLCFLGAWEGRKQAYIDESYKQYAYLLQERENAPAYLPGLFMNLPKERSAEDAEIINSCLHIMHMDNPELRSNALDLAMTLRPHELRQMTFGEFYLSRAAMEERSTDIETLFASMPDVIWEISDKVPGFHDFFYEISNHLDEVTVVVHTITPEDMNHVRNVLSSYEWVRAEEEHKDYAYFRKNFDKYYDEENGRYDTEKVAEDFPIAGECDPSFDYDIGQIEMMIKAYELFGYDIAVHFTDIDLDDETASSAIEAMENGKTWDDIEKWLNDHGMECLYEVSICENENYGKFDAWCHSNDEPVMDGDDIGSTGDVPFDNEYTGNIDEAYEEL